ncbi:14-3-3 protein zeta-like [Branchiostoma lanceolatum]|uniref:14-3-3 protein zeta-like n=1 Tax=Branchiostoma lanceolatum TaxID=7740 RepID=UPI0034554FDE
MRLFVGTLLVTMLVVAMLIDDSEGYNRGRRRRRNKRSMEDVADEELVEIMQEARSLLEELKDLDDLDDMAAERAPMESRGAGYEDNVVYRRNTEDKTMAGSADEKRRTLLQRAKVAEQAEMYEDMVKCMKELVEMGGKLSTEERNLLSVAYKNVVGSRRSAWRLVTALDQKKAGEGVDESDSARQAVKWMREKVVTDLKKLCGDVLTLIDKFVLPTVENKENEVFYNKMKGDYYRYLAEISEGSEREDMVTKAKESYEKAYAKATTSLTPTNPIRLGLALNWSVFHYEIRKDPKEACRVAKEAFDAAISDIDQLKEDSYKDSTLIMQLIRDNLTLWTSEQDQGKN